MKRRNFLKIFAAVPLIPILTKAEALPGIDITPPPVDINIGCGVKGTEGKEAVFYGESIPSMLKAAQDDKNAMMREIANIGKMMDKQDIPTEGRYVCNANTGEIVSFDNLIDPKTFKNIRVKRTVDGWDRV